MSLKSLSKLMAKMEEVEVATAPVAAPVVEEPVTPEPQAPVDVPSEEPAPLVIEEDGSEAPAPVEGDAPVEPIEAPAEVSPAEIEEVTSRVEEVATQVEEEGVTPTTMKFIQDAWGSYMAMFGIRLPNPALLKENNPNIRASVETINAFRKLKKYMRMFR